MHTLVAFVVFFPTLHLVSVEQSALYLALTELKDAVVVLLVKLVFMVENELSLGALVQIA